MTPTGFFGLLQRGDKLQLLYEDCWWDVQFDERAKAPADDDGGGGGDRGDGAAEGAATHFRVSSLQYAKSHTVLEDVLRPLWMWAPQAKVWRYELHMGHGCVGPEADAAPTFKFCTGVGRSRNVLL